ncbi:MAG: DSBA oxidoreductase [Alphaproteobacteria bacterium]|nr:MAG: DSBA oxidoreductase [Alphaproteobacteria bacterium]
MTRLTRLLAAGLLLLLVAPPAAAQENVPADQAEFEARIRAYLMEHPEVIVEALQELERRQQAATQAKQKQAISDFRDELTGQAGDPVAGNPAGAVTVVEFFDYRCPYCKAVAQDMIDTLTAEGDVRIVFKEFPILGPQSEQAARAALAARLQDKYLPFHQALMAHKGELDEAALFGIAEEVGLDVARLRTDMDSAEIDETISRNIKLANTLAIGGTPAFVVGETLVPGALDMDTLRKLVAEAREG